MEDKMDSSPQWVDERLSTLDPADGWQPDVAAGLARWRERCGVEDRRSRKRRFAAVAGTAACLLLAALPQPRAAAQRMWQSFSAPLPKMAPDFTRNDAAGKAISLAEFKGRVVLLNFW